MPSMILQDKLHEGIHFDSSSQGKDSMLTDSPKNYDEASKALRPKNVRYPTWGEPSLGWNSYFLTVVWYWSL